MWRNCDASSDARSAIVPENHEKTNQRRRDFFDQGGLNFSSPNDTNMQLCTNNSRTSFEYNDAFGALKHGNINDSRLLTRRQTKMTRIGACCSSNPLSASLTHQPPSHVVRQVLARPPLQKHLHRGRVTAGRGEMNREVSILRREAAIRQATSPSAQVLAPPSAPAPPWVPTPRKAGLCRAGLHD